MPPLYFHLAVANEAAKRIESPVVRSNLASYLLGATLPDIHLITDGRREMTHFFSLTKAPPFDSIRSLFLAHPELVKNNHLDDSSKVGLAGYLSHLVTDEVWITDIYRPYFGPESPLSADPMANILDRAFQYDLDCQERLNKDVMDEIKPRICERLDIKVSFIDTANLLQWQDFICHITERVPSWDGFVSYAERFLLPLNKISREPLENFLKDFPSMRDRVSSLVPAEKMLEMRQKVIELSVKEAGDYLK